MKKGSFLVALTFLGFTFSQGFAVTEEELLKRIEALTKELEILKAELKELKTNQKSQKEEVSEVKSNLENLKDRMGTFNFKISGDIRTRIDSTRAQVRSNAFLLGILPAIAQSYGGQLTDMFGNPLNVSPYVTKIRSHTEENDSLWTNRMRINAVINPTENTSIKVRLAYYKMWGMGDDFTAPGLFFPMKNNFTFGVRPSDSTLYVDRAYFNWTNIGGLPIWISLGRRPTTHGTPQQFREGREEKDASPLGINIDVPFDGGTLGYDYGWGKIKFCYGRGFESGFKTPIDRAKDDIDFYGLVWDVYEVDNKYLGFQAFKAEDVMDFPSGELYMFNPAFGTYMPTYFPTKYNLGDLYEIGLVWSQSKVKFLGLKELDYFMSLGMSIAEPRGMGKMSMPVFINGNSYTFNLYYSLLTGMSMDSKEVRKNMDTRTGLAVYVGVRIPLAYVPGAKLGLEYNYGSKWWMPFHVGTDDPYLNKLSTRGHVAEIYWQQDLPTGEKYVKTARALLRLGFQYYWFNYYGSANWLETPRKISDIKRWVRSGKPDLIMKAMTMYIPIETMWNLYGSLEVQF